MLEKMAEFFEKRLENYDEHMLNEIESAKEFYSFTADCLPKEAGCHLLDLGCGTGLELEFYFKRNPLAKVTGIDLSSKMLDVLKGKFPNQSIQLIQGSYFEVPFDETKYDAAVSVESLHHFTSMQKVALYKRLYRALKSDGYFILTDYFALSEQEEIACQKTLRELKQQSNLENELVHYDTPLTIEHELEALREAGFTTVEVLNRWGATATIQAIKKQGNLLK